MVNPDSDLYRAHPEWILQIPDQPTHLARHQLVLDLQNPHVFDYVFNALKKILDTYPIDYLKWDMNRPLTQAGHKGYPAMHGHVQQVYRLVCMQSDPVTRRLRLKVVLQVVGVWIMFSKTVNVFGSRIIMIQ